jgi:hypothetical protein
LMNAVARRALVSGDADGFGKSESDRIADDSEAKRFSGGSSP